MTPFYPNLSRWILPLCLIPCCLDAQLHGQSIPPPETAWHTSFITHAQVLLPSLLREQQFASMKNFLANWRSSDYPSPYRYDATIEVRSFILFISAWAGNLMQRSGLNEDEIFICRTLQGGIPGPRAEARRNQASCPRIAYTRQLLANYDNSIITGERDSRSPTASAIH